MKKAALDFQLFYNARLEPLSIGVDEAGFERCAPSHSFGPTARRHYLFHYIVKGKGVYCVGGKTYEVTPGMMFQIKPGETTYYQADAKDPWVYYWFGFHGSEAKDTLEKLGISSLYTFEVEDKKGMEEIFESLQDGDSNPSSMSFSLLSACYRIFSLLVRQFGTAPVLGEGKKPDLVDAILSYVDHHLDQDLRISELSTFFHVDRSHMFRVFKNKMGISPKDYILDARFKRATILLKDTTKTIKEVAIEAGFQDYPSFLKGFKKRFGVSPKEYRKDPFETESNI